MNAYLAIALLARRSLIVLVLAMLCAVGIYLGSGYLKKQAATGLEQARQREREQRASLAQKEADLKDLQAESGRFGQLRRQGLLGNPDRALWAEQFLASYQSLGLSVQDLAYTMHPPRALQGAGADGATAPTAGQGARSLDLDFTIKSIHEEDLLALLRHFAGHVQGLYRLQSCTLAEPQPSGLTARCTLRFFNLPESKSATP